MLLQNITTNPIISLWNGNSEGWGVKIKKKPSVEGGGGGGMDIFFNVMTSSEVPSEGY